MGNEQVPGWVWALLVSIHGVAFAWALSTGTWDFPDSSRYLQAAENLWYRDVLYARPWPRELPVGQAIQEFTIRPIGYPLALLFGGGMLKPPVLVLVWQNLLSLLNIGVVMKWWARCGNLHNGKWGLAVLAVLSFPGQFIYANAVMSEMLLQTVVVGMVCCGLLLIHTRKRKYAVGVVVAAVVALLLKPVFYPWAFVVAVGGMVLAWREKRVGLAVVAGVPLLVVGLYMGWNKQRTGYFHFSSIAEINLLHYNAAGVVREINGAEAEEHWVAAVLREANDQPNFPTRQELIQSRTTAILKEHPMVYARQHAQGMAAMFLDPGRFDISQFLGLAPLPGGGLLAQIRTGGLLRALISLPLGMLSILGLVLLANVVRLVLAVRGFFALKNSAPWLRYGRWVAVGLLFYVAFLTGPLGAARFLVPVWPLLLALALVGLNGPRVLDPEKTAPLGEDQRQG